MRTVTAICCFLFATWTAQAKIYVDGFEGGEVTFRCDHKLASGDDKYFCKDPCKTSTDVLATVKSATMVQSGKMTLVDFGNGSFTVNISRLQLSDAGKYWCAVNRPVFNTYTAVYLTVEKGVEHTVQPDVLPTPTHLDIYGSNSTQLIPELDTSGPTHISTTSNYTNGGEDGWSMSAVLFAAIGAVSTLTVLVCAACFFRKRTEVSKPQPPACSSAHEREEADTVYENTGKQLQSVRNAPTSAIKTSESSCSPIYENISDKSVSRQADANAQTNQNQNKASRIYIKPLPPTVCETAQKGPNANHAHTTTGSSTNGGSDTNSESQSRTLWFGLDVRGTI